METVNQANRKNEELLRTAARARDTQYGVAQFGVAYDSIARNPEYWDLSRDERRAWRAGVTDVLGPQAWLVWSEENGSGLGELEERIATCIAEKTIRIEQGKSEGAEPEPYEVAYERDEEFIEEIFNLAYEGLGLEETLEEGRARLRARAAAVVTEVDGAADRSDTEAYRDMMARRMGRLLTGYASTREMFETARARVEAACDSLRRFTEDEQSFRLRNSEETQRMFPDRNIRCEVENYSYSAIGPSAIGAWFQSPPGFDAPSTLAALGREDGAIGSALALASTYGRLRPELDRACRLYAQGE